MLKSVAIVLLLVASSVADINSDIKTHTLDNPYQFAATVTILPTSLITITNNVTLIGPSVITCSGLARTDTFITIGANLIVVIHDITFHGCPRAILGQGSFASLTIDRCTFNGSSNCCVFIITSDSHQQPIPQQ